MNSNVVNPNLLKNLKILYLTGLNQDMMYVKRLWTLLLLLTAGICGAQNGILNGTVSDEDGEPIIHAQVIADQSLGLTTVTDFDGFYSLELPSGVYLSLIHI